MYGVYSEGKLLAKFSTPLTVRSNQPISVADSLSLKRSVRKGAAQRWEITAPLEPLSHTANELFAEFAVRGFDLKYKITMPQNYGAVQKRVRVGNIHRANASVDQTTVTVEMNSTIPAGTFVRFANHAKIYMVVKDTARSGQMQIYPPLRMSLNNTSFVWEDDVEADFWLDTSAVRGLTFIDGIVADNGALTFLEAL